jgi:hypothetical protein
VTNFIRRIFGQRDERNIVLVFVDAENSTVSPALILKTVETEFGKPRVRQAYAKWSANPIYKNQLSQYRNAGFECITCDSGDNNADIQLSVEAVDTMHDFGNRGKCTLIICADGDRGFAHVFDKARKLGWESVLIANEASGTLGDLLRNSADRVISPEISPDKPVKTETQITEKTGDKEQTDFQEIDRQWNEKVGEGATINNAEAAKIANKIMNVPRLKDTRYKNLTGLIEESDLLARNWVRDGQYETKKNIVDNSALATLTPSVIPESDAQRISGFNTSSNPGRYSLRFPVNPKDLAKLITLIDSHRDEEINWVDLRAKLNEEKVVAKSRTHIFLSLTKHTETWNEKINWNLVNKPLDLALVLRDKVIDNFKKRENLDDGNIPEIEKYFELVSDEILSLKKK